MQKGMAWYLTPAPPTVIKCSALSQQLFIYPAPLTMPRFPQRKSFEGWNRRASLITTDFLSLSLSLCPLSSLSLWLRFHLSPLFAFFFFCPSLFPTLHASSSVFSSCFACFSSPVNISLSFPPSRVGDWSCGHETSFAGDVSFRFSKVPSQVSNVRRLDRSFHRRSSFFSFFLFFVFLSLRGNFVRFLSTEDSTAFIFWKHRPTGGDVTENVVAFCTISSKRKIARSRRAFTTIFNLRRLRVKMHLSRRVDHFAQSRRFSLWLNIQRSVESTAGAVVFSKLPVQPLLPERDAQSAQSAHAGDSAELLSSRRLLVATFFLYPSPSLFRRQCLRLLRLHNTEPDCRMNPWDFLDAKDSLGKRLATERTKESAPSEGTIIGHAQSCWNSTDFKMQKERNLRVLLLVLLLLFSFIARNSRGRDLE